jgi:dTDP-glucose pyrophosphorylase
MSQIFNKPIIFMCIHALNEEHILGIILSLTKLSDSIFICDDGSTNSVEGPSISLVMLNYEIKRGNFY